jgi:regulator of RNase E activity RraA
MVIDVHPLAVFATATIADALDKVERPGCVAGLAPLDRNTLLIGRAFTVRYEPAPGPVGDIGDYLDEVGAGQVVVIDNGGRTDCTVWGEIMTVAAAARGVAGTVIDGVLRDGWRPLQDGYPVFARGRFMRTGKDRVQLAEVEGAVTVGGVDVEPGQLVVGDGDGLVVVPLDLEEELVAICRTIRDHEQSIIDDVWSGRSLAEARQDHGYSVLQRPIGDR